MRTSLHFLCPTGDDEETAIEGIRGNVQTSSVFDMSGRKAQQNTLCSGLYIKVCILALPQLPNYQLSIPAMLVNAFFDFYFVI